ncbi:MAG: menaquinone biosynthesis protein [Abditibacteriaceae bacterium]
MFTLGVVSYLNALPLYRTLETSGRVELVPVVPSKLAELLDAGKVDVAMMPIIDHLRGVGDGIVGNACIGATGAVRSVRMHANMPPEKIRTVAADTSSHTSVALLHVLLKDLYGIEPEFIDHKPDLDQMLQACDAALIIGDTALEIAESPIKSTFMLDLAEGWEQLTGLSFIFAAWIARSGLSSAQKEELAALLNSARDDGLANLKEVVEENIIPTAMSKKQIDEYLRHSIEFTITPAHQAGMEEFRRRAISHQLI